jgi:sarcosine oxidase
MTDPERRSTARPYDVIVLGLGAMGSAAAAQLARRGQRVLGLEQYALGHDRGASHGESRLIRRAYFESPCYVPLLERAYQLWDELAAQSGEPLLHRVGLALCAAQAAPDATPDATSIATSDAASAGPFARALSTAKQVGVTVEELSAAETRARWPALRLPEGFACLYEPGAGFLEVERCVRAHLEQARAHGAELRGEEPVLRWSAADDGRGVEVVTSRGTYSAGSLVIAAGPWSALALAELALPLRVHRVVQLWFAAGEAMAMERGMPCFAFDVGKRFFYGFPRWGGELSGGALAKICEHAPGLEIDPRRLAEVDRQLHPEDSAAVAAMIGAYLPDVDPRPVRGKTCLYTMTPDEDFFLDRHPHHANVQLAAGFSGHGFKFSSVVGEILADLTLEGQTRHPIDFLRLGRLSRFADPAAPAR